MKKYILFVAFFFHCLIVISQVDDAGIIHDNLLKTKLDSIIHQSIFTYLKNTGRVGLSMGVFHNHHSATYHYGSTHKGLQVLPSDQTVYEIGSISKTFTGTLLAQAVKDKKARLTDDVRLYLDGKYPNLEYQGHPIRLSHLVSHISGLPNFLPDKPAIFQNTSRDSLPFVLTRILNQYSKQNFLEDLHKVVIDTIPGYKFRYSNSSPQLLKFVLERVYQNDFSAILREYIYGPLKMNQTTSVFKEIGLQNLAQGHNAKGIPTPYIPESLDAAGGIFSTIPDMLEYLKFHLNEKNEVVALSHQITTGDIHTYAIVLNWQETMTPQNHKKIWQSGGTFGFSSYCVIYPELGIAIVLLTNQADNTAQTELGQIADKIFKNIYTR